MMKQTLLAATAFAAISGLSSSAYAACTPTVMGNLNVFECTSTQSAADADDLMDFINKANVPVTSITGSLGGNSMATVNQNITTATNDSGASFIQQGNGFADLKSNNAGSPTNTLRNLIDTPIVPSTLPKSGNPFTGFDGFLMRGQVDNTNGTTGWDGKITMTIDFAGGASQTLNFTGDKIAMDIGTIGFDEATEPGVKVTSVTTSLDSTGAWNEAKQFDFSVTGERAIPEPSTWVMLISGFGLMSVFAWRKSKSKAKTARLATL